MSRDDIILTSVMLFDVGADDSLYAASNSVDFSFRNITEHGDGIRQYVVYEMLPLCCHVHLLPFTPSL